VAQLALVMVARGETELVERALRSARPFVDEMVVLALDCADTDAAALTKVGARVVRGTWSDDAAAARNQALDAADADWHLVLDPEEFIDIGGEEIREIVDGDQECVGLVEVCRAPGSSHAEDHPRHLAARIIPRGVRYEGAYREEPVFDLPTVQTSVVVVTDDTESGRWRADHARNEALMHQALAVRPGDPHLLLSLADELHRAGRHSEAARQYDAALTASPAADPARHAMVIGRLDSCIKAGLISEAVALMDDQLVNWQHSPDFTYLVGDLFFEMMLNSPSVGSELAPLVDTAWRRCLELGERPDLSGAVHGRGSFLAAQNLYVLNLVLGRGEEADMWLDRAASMRMPVSPADRLLG